MRHKNFFYNFQTSCFLLDFSIWSRVEMPLMEFHINYTEPSTLEFKRAKRRIEMEVSLFLLKLMKNTSHSLSNYSQRRGLFFGLCIFKLNLLFSRGSMLLFCYNFIRYSSIATVFSYSSIGELSTTLKAGNTSDQRSSLLFLQRPELVP